MSLGEIPREVRPGDSITARAFNALRGVVRRSRVVAVGRGLAMRQTDAGVVLALAVASDQVRWARIASDHPQTGAPASTITYDVTLLEDGRTLTGLVPLNRPVRDPAHYIMPARKGSLCAVVFPRAKAPVGKAMKELLVFDELRDALLCTPPTPAP